MPSPPSSYWYHWLIRAAFGAALILVTFYLLAVGRFGTPEAAWARLQGKDIVAIPAKVHVGDCLPGAVKVLDFKVVNTSPKPVTLSGMYTSCSCLLTSSLPVRLAARDEVTLRLTIYAAGDEGQFRRHAVVYTDSSTTPELPLVVVGNILANYSELEPTAQQADPAPAHDG
jgi:hypothetical protein